MLVVRDSPYASHHREELKVRAVARAVRLAWGEPGTRLGLWSHFSAQFGSNVFALLWGFPFLVSGQGLSTGTASALLMLMTVATVIASPIVGTFVTRWPYSRSTLVLWIVAAIMLSWAVVLLWPGRAPLPVLALLVVVISLGGPGSMVGFDLARTFNPPTRIGSATGIVNVGGFLAALSTIALIGLVLDHVAPGGPVHLHHRLVPGRHVGPVPRLGRSGWSRSCGSAGAPAGRSPRARTACTPRCGPPRSARAERRRGPPGAPRRACPRCRRPIVTVP